jgi:hypothetical protein
MTELTDVMKKSADWLLENQDAHTGGWADRAGGMPSILNTAEAVTAILDGHTVQPGDHRIQRAVQFLLRHQIAGGDDRGAWAREFPGNGGGIIQVPDMVRTSFAIEALIKAGTGVDTEPVKNAVQWLLAVRNADSGWGYRRGSPSAPTPTCFALMALIEAHKAKMEECRQPVIDGLDFLVGKHRNAAGSFGPAGPLEAVHTIYATLVLQAARRCELSSYSDREEEAIQWLREHPDEATKLVEERIMIDADGRYNYDFLFMTHSLLIRVLAGSRDKEDQNSALARGTLITLRDRMHPSGGFYGDRVFVWSTAKVLSALSMAVSHFQAFPDRSPEYSGVKAGTLVWVFAILLSAFVVYLTVKGSFELLHAGIFIFLMLALLLAYGMIGEKTFKELVRDLPGLSNLRKKS